MKKVKIIGLWILSIFFILSAIVFFPSFSSLFSALIVALVIPISKWQAILDKYIKRKLKLIIVIILTPLTIFTAPNTQTNVPDDTTAAITAETSYDSTAESTSEPTTVSAIASTAAAITESTTIPTTEPTTAPTTKPPHTHSFSLATCTTPKSCSCGATDGEANGHNWKDATCSDPKKCTVCGTTSGLTAGHNFSNGKCTTCGKADPDYDHETMVWIPTNGGTKYHTHAGCSNMEDPEQVTQSEAESRGFTPCKRCH